MRITGFYFLKNYVVYSTLIGVERFASIHKREGLTDEQAKRAFIREHSREVHQLLNQKMQDENNKS